MKAHLAIDPGPIISVLSRPALAVLLAAFDCAEDCRVDRWQFAIEVTELLSKGASLVDIRWLILRGLAEHGREITLPGEQERSFRPLAVTSFPSDTCLVLSRRGAQALRIALTASQPEAALPPVNTRPSGVAQVPARELQRPEWDEARRELRYQGAVIKRYRVPAPNQELILALFQNLGWPDFIDNPLPSAGEQDAKQRLQSAIKSLNRSLHGAPIRFHGNGNGQQIRWTVMESK